MIVTLAGHVDHGKTELVKALTGVDTDTLAEEKRRGLTINLGFAYLQRGDIRIGFVDVPGHRKFIHNMIAGVGCLQHALLVIAADDGVMPQTREHLQILEFLNLQSGTICITKCDRVDKTRFRKVEEEISTLVGGTFLREAPIHRVSAIKREGITGLADRLFHAATKWDRPTTEVGFRLPIDRAFRLQGIGSIVTGTVTSGYLRVGDRVFVGGIKRTARVRNIHVNDKIAMETQCGDRVGLNLAGVDLGVVRRGHWVLEEKFASAYRRVAVQVVATDSFRTQLKSRVPVHVYHFTDHCQATLRTIQIEPKLQKMFLGELNCDRQMHFKLGDQLILRDHSLNETVAGATVVAPPLLTRKPWNEFLSTYAWEAQRTERGSALQRMSQYDVISAKDFIRFSNISEPTETIGSWNSDVVVDQDEVLAKGTYETTAERIQNLLAFYHRTNTNQPGLTANEIAKRLKLPHGLVNFVVRAGDTVGLKHQGGYYALSQFEQKSPEVDDEFFLRIKPLLRSRPPQPLGDLCKSLNFESDVLKTKLKPLAKAGVIVQVNSKRIFLREDIDNLLNTARRLAAQQPFTVREFRDASQLGRNATIDLLEYFDRIQATIRRGDTRTVAEPV